MNVDFPLVGAMRNISSVCERAVGNYWSILMPSFGANRTLTRPLYIEREFRRYCGRFFSIDGTQSIYSVNLSLDGIRRRRSRRPLPPFFFTYWYCPNVRLSID